MDLQQPVRCFLSLDLSHNKKTDEHDNFSTPSKLIKFWYLYFLSLQVYFPVQNWWS